MPRKKTQEKIENAAIALFAEKGYKGTSTRKIAKEAGVSELTIYRCYKTKDELFRIALLRRAPDKWLKAVEPDPTQSSEEQLLHLCEVIYRTLMERQDLIRIFYRDAAEHPEIVQMVKEIPAKIWGPIDIYLRKLIPTLPESTAKALAFQLFAAYLGKVLLMSSMGEEVIPFPIEEFHRTMAKTYARTLSEGDQG